MLSWLFNSYPMGGMPYGGGGTVPYYQGGIPPAQTPMPATDPNLEQRLHALEAACSGLWELLKVKNGYSDQELIDVIKGLDTKKQAAAADPTSPENLCPKCGHKMLTRNHTRCLWCGADVPANPF